MKRLNSDISFRAGNGTSNRPKRLLSPLSPGSKGYFQRSVSPQTKPLMQRRKSPVIQSPATAITDTTFCSHSMVSAMTFSVETVCAHEFCVDEQVTGFTAASSGKRPIAKRNEEMESSSCIQIDIVRPKEPNHHRKGPETIGVNGLIRARFPRVDKQRIVSSAVQRE